MRSCAAAVALHPVPPDLPHVRPVLHPAISSRMLPDQIFPHCPKQKSYTSTFYSLQSLSRSCCTCSFTTVRGPSSVLTQPWYRCICAYSCTSRRSPLPTLSSALRDHHLFVRVVMSRLLNPMS